MPEPTLGQFLKAGEVISKSLEAHAAEIPHLESPRVKFASLFAEIKDLAAQQAALTAQKQEVTKKLSALLIDGKELLTFLKVGVKQHFGKRAEKLVAFGIQPFRSRRRKAADGLPLKPQPSSEEKPPAQSSNP